MIVHMHQALLTLEDNNSDTKAAFAEFYEIDCLKEEKPTSNVVVGPTAPPRTNNSAYSKKRDTIDNIRKVKQLANQNSNSALKQQPLNMGNPIPAVKKSVQPNITPAVNKSVQPKE